MNALEGLTQQMRKKGFRMTKVRKAIMQFLLERHCALSAQDILEMLEKVGLKPNISTIYRELQFLVHQDIAQEVIFKDGVIRFECKNAPHHHHLVCTSCDTIESIEMNGHLKAAEESIQAQKNFQVLSHSLEFYGVCVGCQA